MAGPKSQRSASCCCCCCIINMATMVRRILRPQLSQPRRRRKHDPAPLIDHCDGDDSFCCGRRFGGGGVLVMIMMMMIVVGCPLGSGSGSVPNNLGMKMVATALVFPHSTITTITYAPPQRNHHHHHHHFHLFRTPGTDSTMPHHHEKTTTSRRSKLGMIFSKFLKRVISAMTSFRTRSNDHSITGTTNIMDSTTRTMPLSFTRPPPPPPTFLSSSSSFQVHPPSSATSTTASRRPISNEDKQKFCQSVWQGQSQHVYIPSLVARPSDRTAQTAVPGASPPPVTDFTTRAHPVGRSETTTKTDQEMDWSNRRAIHVVQERLIQMTTATAVTSNHRPPNSNINQVITTIRPNSPARTSRSTAPLSPAPCAKAGNVHSHQQPSTVSAIPRKRRDEEEEAKGGSPNDPTESRVSAPTTTTQTLSTPLKTIRMEIPTTHLEERLDLSGGGSNDKNATIQRTRTTTTGENGSNHHHHHSPKEQESKIDRAKKWGIDMSKFT